MFDGVALVALLMVVLLWVLPGCARFKTPAAIPSNQMTPVVWNADTAAVLKRGLDTGGKVLASSLEQNTESGSVIYVNHQGWVYNPDGTVFLDKEGKPIRVSTEIVAKLNSLKELATMEGVQDVEYRVGGFHYASDLPEKLQGKDLCPEALYLKITGIGKLAAVDPTAANRKAAGEERTAIFAGLSDLATAEGAAFAVRVQALSKGFAEVTTAAGSFVGQVIKTYAVPIPTDLVKEGVTKLVKAVVRDKDTGDLTDILAADTATVKDASTCVACEATPAK